MRVPQIQQQNCYQFNHALKTKRQDNSIGFQALKVKKDVFTSKNKPAFVTKIGAVAVSAGVAMKELFFNKVLEVDTVNQIKQNAISFGESIAQNIYQNDGKFNREEIENLILTHLGEERSENVQVVTDKEGFCDFAEKYIKLDREYAKSVFDKSGGLVAQGSSEKMMFLLKLEGEKPEVAINIATHEFEHLLYKTSGFIAKLTKKYLFEQTEKEKREMSSDFSGESENKRFFQLQMSLIELLIGKGLMLTPFEYVEQEPTVDGVIELSPVLSSKEELDEWLGRYVRQNMIYPNFDSINFPVLQGFEIVLRDEARAYEAGGKAQRYYNKLMGGNEDKTTLAEMIAVIYNQMADKIQEYKNLIIKSSLKESLGMKPTDYHEPTPENSQSSDDVSNVTNS